MIISTGEEFNFDQGIVNSNLESLLYLKRSGKNNCFSTS